MLPYNVNRGYGNPSLWRKMQTRWERSGAERFILLTISDHDPEGFDLVDDATRSLRDPHDVPVEVVRVGLTMAQIETQGAPPAFAKETSSRFNHTSSAPVQRSAGKSKPLILSTCEPKCMTQSCLSWT